MNKIQIKLTNKQKILIQFTNNNISCFYSNQMKLLMSTAVKASKCVNYCDPEANNDLF